MVPIIISSWKLQELLPMAKMMSMQKVKVRGQGQAQVKHKIWRGIGVVPYCFLMSFFKFQGHTRQTIADFELNRMFPDRNYSFNSQMATKRCTIVFQSPPSNFKVTRDKKIVDFDMTSGLEMMHKGCISIFVHQCHPSNFKVTRDK